MGWTTDVLFPAGAGIFSLCHGAHPASYPMGTGDSFQGYSSRGVKLITHPHVIPRLRIRGDIPPFPQHVLMVWCLVNHTDNFAVFTKSVTVGS